MVRTYIIIMIHRILCNTHIVPGTLREGCFCGYQSDNGNYFRVQVLKFSQEPGLYFPHNEKARVNSLDLMSS